MKHQAPSWETCGVCLRIRMKNAAMTAAISTNMTNHKAS